MTSIKPEIMIIYLTHSCSAGPEWSDLISPDPLRYSALVLKRFILGADISIAVMSFYAARVSRSPIDENLHCGSNETPWGLYDQTVGCHPERAR